MAKIKREQTISLQWYREGNDPYLNTNKPEVYWFVENGIKRKFDSLEAMKAELSSSRKEKESKNEVVEEIINHKFMTAEKKEALRRKFQKEWEEEQKNKKARAGFIVEKQTGGEKIYDHEDGYVKTFPVMDLEELKEFRMNFMEGDQIPVGVWNTACNTWGDLVLEFTHKDWVSEIQAQIDERTHFEYMSPKAAEFKMRSYPITENFKWDNYRPWDKHPWAVLDHLYCAANHINEEEVMVDASHLDDAEFYCKWGFQVLMVNLPERKKITPSMLLKYEDCRGIMHMTLRVDKNELYGNEASYGRLQFNDKTGCYEYAPENEKESDTED